MKPARSVNIAELKNHLSSYLNQVRRGEEILIRDRNLPIAKIVPLASADEFDRGERALVASGQVRLPNKPVNWKAFWAMKSKGGRRISIKRAAKAVSDDRDEREDGLLGR